MTQIPSAKPGIGEKACTDRIRVNLAFFVVFFSFFFSLLFGDKILVPNDGDLPWAQIIQRRPKDLDFDHWTMTTEYMNFQIVTVPCSLFCITIDFGGSISPWRCRIFFPFPCLDLKRIFNAPSMLGRLCKKKKKKNKAGPTRTLLGHLLAWNENGWRRKRPNRRNCSSTMPGRV